MIQITTRSREGVSLADDWVEDCHVECPLHASRFSLLTGHVDAPPAKLPVRVHRVEVTDGNIYVAESTDAPNLPPGVSV